MLGVVRCSDCEGVKRGCVGGRAQEVSVGKWTGGRGAEVPRPDVVAWRDAGGAWVGEEDARRLGGEGMRGKKDGKGAHGRAERRGVAGLWVVLERPVIGSVGVPWERGRDAVGRGSRGAAGRLKLRFFRVWPRFGRDEDCGSKRERNRRRFELAWETGRESGDQGHLRRKKVTESIQGVRRPVPEMSKLSRNWSSRSFSN